MNNSPQMVWTFYKVDSSSNRIDSNDYITFERKNFIRNLDSVNDPNPSGSKSFWDAIAISNRALIIDNYLKQFQIKILIKELNNKYNFFKRYQNYNLKKQNIEFLFLNKYNASLFYSLNKNLKNNLISINYYNCLIDKHIHDRFAILDGEIWIFGAAFANLHGGFTVATRGWEDNNNELRSFFDNIINQHKQSNPNSNVQNIIQNHLKLQSQTITQNNTKGTSI